ncbi:MAG TPA: hypothetical protein PKL73_00800 [Polyangiaceae bacterium]|jgi:hypothetical protein|nr:hypothetical protein [Polyangiaceae bacterium]HNZ20605.1 hypothetical protein [Polyangiaceae bacterium]HOD20779.1 hypothetical protein [Polyangiaceae bacterium]HOE47199.1 hypothetical protein [Polyangiaceae bacterium]HOG99135.1 hypothetical protein [Polyangiaceae bacterium]
MNESRSGAHVERSGSVGPFSQRDSPEAQTGSTHAPLEASQTCKPAQGSSAHLFPSAAHTARAAVPGLPSQRAEPGSHPVSTLSQDPVVTLHVVPVGHICENQPRPSARHISTLPSCCEEHRWLAGVQASPGIAGGTSIGFGSEDVHPKKGMHKLSPRQADKQAR